MNGSSAPSGALNNLTEADDNSAMRRAFVELHPRRNNTLPSGNRLDIVSGRVSLLDRFSNKPGPLGHFGRCSNLDR